MSCQNGLLEQFTELRTHISDIHFKSELFGMFRILTIVIIFWKIKEIKYEMR